MHQLEIKVLEIRCVQRDPVFGLADVVYVNHSLEALECNANRQENSDNLTISQIMPHTAYNVQT